MSKLVRQVLLQAVLFGLPQMGTAQEKFERWVAVHYEDTFHAYTTNDAGSEFGLACRNECRWYLDAKVHCVDDRDYPVLVNTGSGSAFLLMRCLTAEDDGRTRYVLASHEFGKLTPRSRDQVGFAIALDGGKFEVLHFSLTGLGDAMAALARAKTRNAKYPDDAI